MTTGAPAADAEGREPGSEEPTGFVGRGGWHLVAFLAALALVLVMSIDWYTTEQGEEFRRVEDNARSGQQVDPDIDERAAQAAENEEKTAWQADALVDRLIVLGCLIAFLGAVVAAFMRSAGRRPEPPWHPSAIATVAGVAATLLILYRMIQPPGINDAAVIEIGAPLGLIAVGILTIGSRLAVLGERGELAAGGAPEVAAGPPPEDEGAPEPEADGESFLARFRRRRERGAEAAVAGAPPADAEPAEASAFEFDFPAPAPDAEEREGEGEEEAELLDEAEEHAPPMDERPVGAESPEEAPEWAAPDPESAEEAPEEAEDAPEEPAEDAPDEPAEPVPDLILEDPVEAEPVGGETVEEEPVEAAAADADLLDEEPPEAAAAGAEPLDEGLEDEPVEEELLDDDPVEEEPVADGSLEDEPRPVEEPPVEEPPVEEPPVEEPEEPLALGEEIEFEYEEDAPRPEEGDDPDEQRPG